MIFNSLDSICRSVLLRKNSSLHFYLDCIIAARDCLSILAMDDLRVINTKLLSVNAYGAIDLPSDFVDETSVDIMVGQKTMKLTPDDSISSLNNFDSSLNIIRYDESASSDMQLIYGWFGAFGSLNQYGENLGRYFGGSGDNCYTYKVVRKRNQIQLNEALSIDDAILNYISNGIDADAATKVPPYAVQTIEDYILWQLKEHRRDISEGEKQRAENRYINSRLTLRARNNPLTIDLLRSIVVENTRQSIK